jgi:cytochrome c-type biogenesis protein CcmH
MAFVWMALLAVAAGLWMTRPLWRAQVEGGQRRRNANVVAYRQRLAEMEADQAAGLLDAETARNLRAELDARLLIDAETVDAAPSLRDRRPLMAGVLAVFALALGAGGYALDGSWKVQQQVAAGPAATPGAPVGGPPGSVEDMVAQLAKRLETNPDDLDGWAMLGRSYFMLEKYQDASKAYARANELSQRSEPDLLVNEGEIGRAHV